MSKIKVIRKINPTIQIPEFTQVELTQEEIRPEQPLIGPASTFVPDLRQQPILEEFRPTQTTDLPQEAEPTANLQTVEPGQFLSTINNILTVPPVSTEVAVQKPEELQPPVTKEVGAKPFPEIQEALEAPIVSPTVERGITKLTEGEGIAQKVGGLLDIGIGSVETLFSPISKLFGIGTGALSATQRALENITGLDPAETDAGEVVNKFFEVAAIAPEAGERQIKIALDKLGVPEEVQNLGLSPEQAQAIQEPIRAGSSFLAQAIAGTAVGAGLAKVKPEIPGEPLKPLEGVKAPKEIVEAFETKAKEITEQVKEVEPITRGPKSRLAVNKVQEALTKGKEQKTKVSDKIVTEALKEVKDQRELTRLEGIFKDILKHNEGLPKKIFKRKVKPVQKAKIEAIEAKKAEVKEIKKPTLEKVEKVVKEVKRPEIKKEIKIEPEKVTKEIKAPKVEVKVEKPVEVVEKAPVEIKAEKRVEKRVPETEQAGKPQAVTGIKKSIIEFERSQRGLEELKQAEVRGEKKVFQEAQKQIKEGKADPFRLVEELQEKPRATTDTENAVLRIGRNILKENIEKTTKKIEEFKSKADKQGEIASIEELVKLEDQLNASDIASTKAGTESGRSLQSRKALIDRDYNLVNNIQRARTANKGERLTPEVRTRVENLSKQLEVEIKKSEGLQEKLSKVEAEKEFRKLQREVKFEERQARRKVKKETLDKEFDNLIKEFAKAQTLNVGLTSQQISLYTRMTKNRIQSGVTSLEAIVDQLFQATKDKIEGVTKREIRDAISGVTRIAKKVETKSDLVKEFREIQKQGKLISKIEDVQAGITPKSTPRKKQAVSKKVAELREELKVALEETGIGEKLSLEQSKKRLKAREEELKRRLKEKDFDKPGRKITELDPEAVELKDRIDLLKDQIDTEIFKIEQQNRTFKEKAIDNIIEVGGTFKTLASGGELSAMLRQGLVLTVGHPVLAAKGAFLKQFEALKSEKNFRKFSRAIEESPNKRIMDQSELFISSRAKNLREVAKREETIQSKIVENIPGLGQLAKMSNRAFMAYLDTLRMDVFNKGVEQLRQQGKTFEKNPKDFKILADFINKATGRGKLGKTLESAVPLLNNLFFAPKLLASRVQMLNPRFYLDPKTPKSVRIMAMKSVLGTIGFNLTLLSLAKMAGAEVESDPRSSDFGKIRVGKQRIDPWGGLQPLARFAAQFYTGQSKSTKTGEIRDLDGKTFPFTTRGDLILNFAKSKRAPLAGLVWDAITGKDFFGKDVNIPEETLEMIFPLFYRDMFEAIKEDGIKGGLLTLPGFVGAGVQTFEGQKELTKTEESEIKRLTKQKRNFTNRLKRAKTDKVKKAIQKRLDKVNNNIDEIKGR